MAKTPFRRLLHWGPITVLAIIKLITWSMVHMLGMWWPPQESMAATLHAAMFLSMAAATLYYFMQSLLEGPGYVPLGWKPEKEEDKEYLQYCTICKGYKAPRSHHCSQCGSCVKKMDHHCPWINCCVGHANHGYFNLFLTSAVMGCFHASVVLSICMYHAINRVWYKMNGMTQQPMVYVTVYTLPLTLLAIGMALGVVLAVGALLYFQIKGMVKNRTTIEDWIVEKATARRAERGLSPFVYPYDVGTKRNVYLALWGGGDGITWPLREGCSQYDLTCEQIAQKQDKRSRSRVYTAIAAYGGWWLPLTLSRQTACSPPCLTEPRLPLAARDCVTVTRHRRHWLFGELQSGSGDGSRGPRGWFPRCVVVPADEYKVKPD